MRQDDNGRITLSALPLGLLVPYAPVLNDIFIAGSVSVLVDDLSDEVQKKLHVCITLLPDCRIKSADEILAPAIQVALRQLDHASLSELQDAKKDIERLKLTTESVRRKVDEITQVLDKLSFLASRSVQEEYAKFKSQYDRAAADYEEWNTKLETLLLELDQVKVRLVEDTFQAFINSGVPIEVDLQEVDGEWQFDTYAVIIGLIEKNYQTIIATDYKDRIRSIRESVARLLTP
jgi:DNA repair exonuclease SbcCD ATPase subunit